MLKPGGNQFKRDAFAGESNDGLGRPRQPALYPRIATISLPEPTEIAQQPLEPPQMPPLCCELDNTRGTLQTRSEAINRDESYRRRPLMSPRRGGDRPVRLETTPYRDPDVPKGWLLHSRNVGGDAVLTRSDRRAGATTAIVVLLCLLFANESLTRLAKRAFI